MELCERCIYFLPLEDVDVCLTEPKFEDMTAGSDGVIIACKKFDLNKNINNKYNDKSNSDSEPQRGGR